MGTADSTATFWKNISFFFFSCLAFKQLEYLRNWRLMSRVSPGYPEVPFYFKPYSSKVLVDIKGGTS